MGDGFDWRWVLRWHCRAIASCDTSTGEFQIKLCRRWRWHGGECK